MTAPTSPSVPVLCYVREPWAWFTTAPLEQQWGDDWNDAPYEHNAGEPYMWREGRGLPEYSLVKVAYDELDMVTPDWNALNSAWSVQDINGGAVPWLSSPSWAASPRSDVFAGTTLPRFCEIVRALGGVLYTREAMPS